MTSSTGNLYKVEIRDIEARKEETLKAIQLGPVPRDSQVVDRTANLMAGGKPCSNSHHFWPK